ncbi:MAG: hypothetical protein R6U98_20065, partial [Pirellulaceae bacterium]
MVCFIRAVRRSPVLGPARIQLTTQSSCLQIFLSSNLRVVPYRATCKLMAGETGPVEPAQWTGGNRLLEIL